MPANPSRIIEAARRALTLWFTVKGAKAMRRIGERTANETLKPEVVASFEDRDVRSVWWVNDQRLLLELEVELTGPGRADRGPGLFAVDADGGSYRPLIETAHAFRRGAPLSVPLLG